MKAIAWSDLRDGVVLAPNWLGDAVMALPALEALRAATPGCRWRVAARRGLTDLFALAGFECDALDAAPGLRWPGPRAEIAILLPNSWHAALLAWRGRAPIRLGYRRDGREALLTHAFPHAAPGRLPPHESFHYLELLRLAGAIPTLPDAEPESLRVALAPRPADVAAWRERLIPGGGRLIALHAGSSFGAAKCWLPERFAATAARLAGEGWRIVLIGGAGERELAESASGGRAGAPGIENLAGTTTLGELATLLAACDALLANDSGPMHLAAAVGTPVVAIFGSTNERETFPLTIHGRLRLVKAAGVECSPCKLRTCPIDHRCMTRIGVDEVVAACLGARLPESKQ